MERLKSSIINNNISVISVNFDYANIEIASSFKQLIFSLIDDGFKNFILDLTNATLIDSTFLGVIVVTHKKLKPINGELKLVGCNKTVQLAFGLSNLDKIFRFYDSVEEAGKDF